MTVLVPDTGIGNIASVIRMAEKVGFACFAARRPVKLQAATKIVLAGVGAFDHGMESLNRHGWRDELEAARERGVPMLGICLGMQMMCRGSEEGKLPGLAWIDASVLRFQFPESSKLRVPHMGWNTLTVQRDNPIIPASGEKQRFYFVHSYHVMCQRTEDIVATTDYGHPVVAAFQNGNLFGVQFHPEKSHRFGMALLGRFLSL